MQVNKALRLHIHSHFPSHIRFFTPLSLSLYIIVVTFLYLLVYFQENMLRLEETMNLFIEKLEQERERSEVCQLHKGCVIIDGLFYLTLKFLQRLENQINDITELHQHEVKCSLLL